MIKATEVINHSDVKVVLLGPGGVGKTCITMRYIKGEFDEYYDPSSRNSFYKKYNINGEVGVLELLDTGGQEDYVSITDDWIRQGMAFLLVYSIDSTYTFENIESILKRIK
jgi:small GTP-binding protein